MAQSESNGKDFERKMQHNSSNSDDEPVHMRIGDEYQAAIPPLEATRKPVSRGPALVIWKPHTMLPEHILLKFVEYSRTKYGYREEQALGLLVCHRYNVDEANRDLVNFVPYPDDWTGLEKQTFELGFTEHGKNFHKIKMMLPDKSVSNIVKYYYIWKKTRSKYQTLKNKLKSRRGDSDDDSYDDGNEHKNKRIRMGSSSLMTSNFTQSQLPIIQALYSNAPGSLREPCTNCHRAKAVTLVTLRKEHLLCLECSEYYQKYSSMRPLFESTIETGDSNEKGILDPPRDMDLTLDSLKLVASNKDAHHYLACLTNQIMTQKHKCLEQKQEYKKMKKDFRRLNIEQYRVNVDQQSTNKGWSDQEIEMLTLCLKHYGKDFDAASTIIGSKTASQCRNTYYAKKDKYEFDEFIKQYEKNLECHNLNKFTEKNSIHSNHQKHDLDDDDVQIVEVTPTKKKECTPPFAPAKSLDFVFKMHINGVTRPVRLQRVPIHNTDQTLEPSVIDLTDDNDGENNNEGSVELKLSSNNEHVKYMRNAITKVMESINVADDEIQIVDSNGMT